MMQCYKRGEAYSTCETYNDIIIQLHNKWEGLRNNNNIIIIMLVSDIVIVMLQLVTVG